MHGVHERDARASERIKLNLKKMSPIQYRAHSDEI
jgi:hypothetical protein